MVNADLARTPGYEDYGYPYDPDDPGNQAYAGRAGGPADPRYGTVPYYMQRFVQGTDPWEGRPAPQQAPAQPEPARPARSGGGRSGTGKERLNQYLNGQQQPAAGAGPRNPVRTVVPYEQRVNMAALRAGSVDYPYLDRYRYPAPRVISGGPKTDYNSWDGALSSYRTAVAVARETGDFNAALEARRSLRTLMAIDPEAAAQVAQGQETFGDTMRRRAARWQ